MKENLDYHFYKMWEEKDKPEIDEEARQANQQLIRQLKKKIEWGESQDQV